jgi:hypothetical protein
MSRGWVLSALGQENGKPMTTGSEFGMNEVVGRTVPDDTSETEGPGVMVGLMAVELTLVMT